MLTGIVVALPEETGTLTPHKIAKGDRLFISDTLLIACSGAGSENARVAAENLVAQGATRLISWGCAAALNETLKPGDLIVTDTLIDSELTRFELTAMCSMPRGTSAIPGGRNASWLGKTLSILQEFLVVHSGTLAESKNVVATSELKKQLRSHTGADVLDMESVAVAKVAKQNVLPFLAIRAVADPVNMDLPEAVNQALSPEGAVSLSKLLLFLMLHPSELPGLIKLGCYFNAAKKKLKLVAKHLNAIITIDQLNG